jgi:cytochrome P450
VASCLSVLARSGWLGGALAATGGIERIRLPAGPRGGLIAGNLTELARDRLGTLTRYAGEYGDVVALRMGPWRYLLISDPGLIEEVLVGRRASFRKGREYRLNRLTLGNGLLTSEGDWWLRQRRLMQPAFRREAVAGSAPVIVESAERELSTWSPRVPVNVLPAMLRMTLDAAARTLFGTDVEGREEEVAGALLVALERFRSRFDSLLTVPDQVPTRANVRLRAAVRRLDRLVDGMVARHTAVGDRDDLLGLLLRARDEDGSRMSDRQLRDEVRTLLLAGHETTANALTWITYLIARHPDVGDSLAEEARRVAHTRTLGESDAPRLRYAGMVVKEALRLYPPSWGITRQATEDCCVGPYRVRRGVHIAMCQWIVHRDARWFRDPHTFRPQRWGDEDGRRPRYTYFPFGGGQRLCIGAPFAMLELVLSVATLARRYRVHYDGTAAPQPLASITLRPQDDVLVTVSER